MHASTSHPTFDLGLRLIGAHIVKDWNKYSMNKKLDSTCFAYLNNLKMTVLVPASILFILWVYTLLNCKKK